MTERKHLYGRPMERRPLPEKEPDEVTLKAIPSSRPDALRVLVKPFSGMSHLNTGFGDVLITMPKAPWEEFK